MAEGIDKVAASPAGTIPEGGRPLAGDLDWLGIVVDSIGDGFGLIGPDFTILKLNLKAVAMDGRPRDELVGRSHWEVYPGTEQSAIGTLYKKAMAERVPVAINHRYQWPDGRISDLETRAFPTENGCLAIFYRDVTEQYQADARLRAGEQRFRAAVAATEGVLWTNSAEGEMVNEQPGWAALTGQSFEAYQGYGWADAVHPEDAQPTIDAWQAALAARSTFVFEHRVRRHDGEYRTFAIRAIPIIDGDGSIVEWVGVHHDITDYRQAQEQIARSAETFTNLVVSNPFGIYVVDADFKLTTISQGAQTVFAGITPLIGRDFDEIIHIIWQNPFADEVVSRFRHTLATGETYVAKSTSERRDIAAVESYDWRIERITLPDGRFGVVCYFYDLSERNAYEAQLQQALEDKDLLAREIDHRVKNSLTVVGSLLSMQRGTATSDEARAALSEAVDRVMAVARVHERLHKSHEVGIVAFGDYLQQMCVDLGETMRGRGVTLTCHAVQADLSAETAMSLALIANELVTNAFKHGRAQGATKVELTLDQVGDKLVMGVSDNGAGMPAIVNDRSASLGFKLIDALSRQLNATTSFPPPGGAATFRIEIEHKGEREPG